MKRVPLPRNSGLARKSPPKPRNEPLATAKKVLEGGKKNPRPRRETGPSVATRKTVIERAAGHCERCGAAITGMYSLHHRKPRGMGGTKDPAINSPANLVLLCGSATSPNTCHTNVERFRASAITTGFIVPQAGDPEAIPIKFKTGWWLLRPDGTKLPTTRPEETDE